MAEIKVSQLPEASEINDSDLLMIIQGGTNKKITKENCKFASGDEVYIGDTEPTGDDTDSLKLWVEPSEDSVDAEGTYISNTYGVSTEIGYSEAYLNNNDSYSTSEILTNKRWIDGKPIYRKILTGTLPSSSGWNTQAINISSLNVDNVSFFDMYFTNGEGNLYKAPFYEDSNYYCAYTIMSNKNYIALNVKGFLSQSYRIIVEYTKTTD